MKQPDRQEIELGSNFVAAFIATSQGVALDEAFKIYAPEVVGEYSIELARQVIEDMHERYRV
jgi:hypothetical protein